MRGGGAPGPLACSILCILAAQFSGFVFPHSIALPHSRTPARSRQSASYHIVQRVALGGEGGWDYLTVDTASRRLFIARATHVQVVDLERGAAVGDIPETPGVHGIALAPALGRGFTSNGRDSSVTIFDLRTLARVGTVRVTGRNPDAILYEPVSHRVFTFNGGSANATAIDAARGTVVGTIVLDGRPEFATADGAGRIFVNLEDRSTIAVLDARTLTLTNRWPLAPCTEPSGMAIDRAHGRLFVGCANRMMAVVDARDGRVVTTLPIGAGVDANAFDPGTQLAFSSNGEGTLTVVHEDAPNRYRVVATAPTLGGARTMALDERTHRVYTVTARFGPTPPPTADHPRPRPPVLPGSFTLLVLDRS